MVILRCRANEEAMSRELSKEELEQKRSEALK